MAPSEAEKHAPAKKYLGDGVYVELELGMLKLTTEDGISVTNTIYLESEVYDHLVRYVDGLRAKADEAPIACGFILPDGVPCFAPLPCATHGGTEGR